MRLEQYVIDHLKPGTTAIFELLKKEEVPVECKVVSVLYEAGRLEGILAEVIGIPNSDHVVQNKGAWYIFPWRSISNIRVFKKGPNEKVSFEFQGGCV